MTFSLIFYIKCHIKASLQTMVMYGFPTKVVITRDSLKLQTHVHITKPARTLAIPFFEIKLKIGGTWRGGEVLNYRIAIDFFEFLYEYRHRSIFYQKLHFKLHFTKIPNTDHIERPLEVTCECDQRFQCNILVQ